MADGIDLNSLLGATGMFSNQMDNASSSIAGITQQGADIAATKEQNAKDAADAASLKTQADLIEQSRQEASRSAIAARLGTDASKPGWVIGQAFDSIKQSKVGLDAAAQSIADKRSINFLTNPVGWLNARMTINGDIAQYNLYEDQITKATELAKTAESMTQTAFQTNNALSSTVTQAYIGAAKILGSYQYNQSASDAAMQGARWNMEGIVQATNMSRDKLTMLYSANHAQMQEKQYQTELSRLNLATQEFDLRKQAFTEKTDEDSLISKYIQTGYQNLTGKQMDPLSTKNAILLYKSKQPDAQAWFESGLSSSMVTNGDGTKPVISLSPFRSANLVENGKVVNMSPAMQQVGDQLVSWRRSFQPLLQNPAMLQKYGIDPKNKQSVEDGFNTYVADQMKTSLANPQDGSVFSPYSLDKVAQVSKTVANMPVWKNVLAPAAATGVNVSDPNLAFGLITSAMRDGKLSYADALDLPTAYAAGLHLNNQMRNFMAFGLPTAKGYNANIRIPGSIGTTNVNMTDRNAFAAALNKAEALAASRDNSFGGSRSRAATVGFPVN